jgi:hypothetical protein
MSAPTKKPFEPEPLSVVDRSTGEDRLLRKLQKVFGEPRADIAPQLLAASAVSAFATVTTRPDRSASC